MMEELDMDPTSRDWAVAAVSASMEAPWKTGYRFQGGGGVIRRAYLNMRWLEIREQVWVVCAYLFLNMVCLLGEQWTWYVCV